MRTKAKIFSWREQLSGVSLSTTHRGSDYKQKIGDTYDPFGPYLEIWVMKQKSFENEFQLLYMIMIGMIIRANSNIGEISRYYM